MWSFAGFEATVHTLGDEAQDEVAELPINVKFWARVEEEEEELGDGERAEHHALAYHSNPDPRRWARRFRILGLIYIHKKTVKKGDPNNL
jgi:hypothetical protein